MQQCGHIEYTRLTSFRLYDSTYAVVSLRRFLRRRSHRQALIKRPRPVCDIFKTKSRLRHRLRRRKPLIKRPPGSLVIEVELIHLHLPEDKLEVPGSLVIEVELIHLHH